jgi:hypothetical protein
MLAGDKAPIFFFEVFGAHLRFDLDRGFDMTHIEFLLFSCVEDQEFFRGARRELAFKLFSQKPLPKENFHPFRLTLRFFLMEKSTTENADSVLKGVQ